MADSQVEGGPVRFTDIPRELRNMVYEHYIRRAGLFPNQRIKLQPILSEHMFIPVPRDRPARPPTDHNTWGMAVDVPMELKTSTHALAFASRQVRNEYIAELKHARYTCCSIFYRAHSEQCFIDCAGVEASGILKSTLFTHQAGDPAIVKRISLTIDFDEITSLNPRTAHASNCAMYTTTLFQPISWDAIRSRSCHRKSDYRDVLRADEYKQTTAFQDALRFIGKFFPCARFVQVVVRNSTQQRLSRQSKNMAVGMASEASRMLRGLTDVVIELEASKVSLHISVLGGKPAICRNAIWERLKMIHPEPGL